MKFITNIIKTWMPKTISKPIGRWKTETCNIQMIHKIDLSNEDHCGPCGQYALKKLKDNHLKHK
jgi:hypothetical protein